MESEEGLKRELEELHKQIARKQKFEEAVSSLRSLLRDRYLSASPSLRKQLYSVVYRVATVLKSRYTAPGFWLAGLRLFEEAEKLVSESTEKEYLRNCVNEAKQYLNQPDNPPVDSASSSSNRGYLFEGHLTVDPEPPQPLWLVQQNLEHMILAAQASNDQGNSSVEAERFSQLLENLVNEQSVEELINNPDSLLSMIMENETRVPRAPPASKEVVAKLPVVILTEEILAKLGHDVECPICKENMVVNDEMQELPCKHKFHPPCLKPWLDEHNSCPICRDELPTDDHNYESWKEREKEAEEERKGAANAVRGGEYMYV